MVGVTGTEMTPDVEVRLSRIGPSGVIFFAANFTDAAGAARYARAVHQAIGTPSHPALVGVDEEGGMVSQLAAFWDVPPSARAVASSGGPPLVKDLAARTARRLLALGINLDFAPVVDIHSNPRNPVIGIRSFGTSASQVAVRAIEAGVDLLLYSKLEPGPEEALAALREALGSGRLSPERVGASIERIRALRAGSAARPPDFSAIVEREARDRIPAAELERIAEGASRLLRQGAGGIPLRQPVDVLEVNRPESRAAMSELLRAHGMNARELGIDQGRWPKRIEGSALLTIAARGSVSPEQEALARAWLRRFPETVTVASLNPHVADDWPEVRTLLATFDNTPASRRALAKRLAG